MLNGIDISSYQTTTPPLDGLAFVFVKASEGTKPDPLYPMHATDVRAAGLPLFAYHYNTSSALVSVDEQVAAFLKAAPDADLWALDMEGGSAELFDPVHAAEFIAAVQATGRRCGLYHSDAGFLELGQDFNWIAKWSTWAPSDFRWDFWQYQGSPLDSDRFAGDAAALAALIKGDKMATLSWKPVGPQPVTGTTVDFLPGHDLLSTSDPVNLRYPQPNGVPGLRVIARAEFRQIADGATVDVDGNPAGSNDPRVPVYILDGALPDGTPFGVVAAALVTDCGPLQVPVIVDPLQAALDAANAKIKAAQEALA